MTSKPISAYLSAYLYFFLILLQPPCTDKNYGMWLGLTDQLTENTFIWDSTQKGMTYNAWSYNQPDNNYGLQDCVHMWCWNNNGEWDDDYCDDGNHKTLCEVPIQCPEPISE